MINIKIYFYWILSLEVFFVILGLLAYIIGVGTGFLEILTFLWISPLVFLVVVSIPKINRKKIIYILLGLFVLLSFFIFFYYNEGSLLLFDSLFGILLWSIFPFLSVFLPFKNILKGRWDKFLISFIGWGILFIFISFIVEFIVQKIYCGFDGWCGISAFFVVIFYSVIAILYLVATLLSLFFLRRLISKINNNDNIKDTTDEIDKMFNK